MTRDSARLGSIPPPPCGCNRVCLSGRVDGKPTPQRPHRRPYKRPRPPSPERLNVSARGAEAGTPRRESRRWRQGRAKSSGEPPKEGRRRNSRQPKHEQERRGTAPEGRLLNDVAKQHGHGDQSRTQQPEPGPLAHAVAEEQEGEEHDEGEHLLGGVSIPMAGET